MTVEPQGYLIENRNRETDRPDKLLVKSIDFDHEPVNELVPDTRLQAIADALDDGTIHDIVRRHLQSANDGGYTSGYNNGQLDSYADDCMEDIRAALTEGDE